MKNKIKKATPIICMMLLVVIVQAMGITYAKYLSSEKGIGSAEVAKWAFQIKKDGAETKEVQLVNTVNKNSLIDGKIAPGTSGEFTIVVDGTGAEVALEYSVEFANEQNKPTNIVYTYGGLEYKSLSDIKNIKGVILHTDQERTREIKIMWSWPYETGSTSADKATNNEIDTQDASAVSNYTFEIVATGTQLS